MPFNQAPAAVRAAFTVSHLPSPPPPLAPRPAAAAAAAAAPRTKAKKPKIDHALQEENGITAARTNAVAAPQQQQAPIQQPSLLLLPPAPATRKSPRTTKKPKRKTLTSKGKRAVILNVLASVEAQKFTTTAPPMAVAPPPPPPTVTPRPVPAPPTPETCNIGKSWTKEDLAKLTRLVEDSNYLHELIPDHPSSSITTTTTSTTRVAEMDWELISKSFGRYSKGGTAVKHQYNAVLRVLKQARREGRTAGSNYIDLVQKALRELPESSGTVYDIQAVLKKKYSKHLDKYKVKGQVRWKRAVGECLREEESLFEAVGKTETGKIVWKLVG